MIEMEPVDIMIERSPEQKLCLAILNQSIRDLGSSSKRIRSDARGWFASDSKSRGSLMWVCNALNIDPEEVRGRVKIWTRKPS